MGFALMVVLPLGLKGIWELGGQIERKCHVGTTKSLDKKIGHFFPYEILELALLSIIQSVSKALAWQGTRVDRNRRRHSTVKVLFFF